MLVENDADTATLTTSAALVATLPVTNLQETSRKKVARTTNTASIDIKGTWSANRCLSCLTLWRHNLSASGTVRLQLYSDAAWTTSIYDSGAVAAHPIKALGDMDFVYDPLQTSVFTGWDWTFTTLWFAAIWARSFKVTLADGAPVTTYFQAARLILGRHIEPLYNMSYGLELGWDENTKLYRTYGGSLRSESAEAFRRMKISLEHLTDGNRARVVELMRIIGKRKDFFISGFPGTGGAMERDHAMVAKFSSMPVMNYSMFGVHATQFQIEET